MSAFGGKADIIGTPPTSVRWVCSAGGGNGSKPETISCPPDSDELTTLFF